MTSGRPLTTEERAALEHLLSPFGPDEKARTSTAGLLAVGRCDCGRCPSVELAVADAPLPPDDASRVVVTAGHGERGFVLLFVDDGVPSFLEYATIDPDDVVRRFPPVAELDDPTIG